jgi:hypothetical protein
MRIPHHISDNPDGTMGFIKSSALYLLGHMEPSLRLSLYLGRSLGGYSMGTTMGY